MIDAKLTSMCGVCWNDNGKVSTVFVKCLPFYVEPKIAEAMCIREVLSWVKELKEVTIASDALLSVNAINDFVEGNSYFGAVISDCRMLLESFPTISVNSL